MVAPNGLKTASQPKKQQSISSFFTPKAVVTPPSTNAAPPATGSLHPGTSSGNDNRGGGFANGKWDDSNSSSGRRVSAKRPLEDEDVSGIDKGSSSGSKRHRTSPSTPHSVDEGEDTPGRDKGSSFGSRGHRISPSKPHSVGEDDDDQDVPAPPPISNRKPRQRISGRTSKYLFAGSSRSIAGDGGPDPADENTDPAAQRQKERLHQKFIKKLGNPDSMTEIKRRRWQNSEAVGDDSDSADCAEGGEDQGSAVAGPSKPKGPKDAKRGPANKKSNLTPMERQFLEIKKKHMDTLLVMEVGYKFRFLGEDARTASKTLSIMCIPGKFRYDEHPSEAHLDRFASASIPVHRLHVHVKRLVTAGHKVGVVRQLETAALKAAGDNKNRPFVRKLTNLYTKGTYIDDVEGLDGPIDGPSGGVPATGYLLCITETNAKGLGVDEKVHVGIVAVQPATGDVIYDDFEDGFMRSEIETRLLHISPCEFLIVGELSKATEKLVQHLSSSSTTVFGDKIRVERVEKPKTMAAQSYSHVSGFYADKMKESQSVEDENASNVLDEILKLSEHVTVCLSVMITHMTEYGLEHVFDLTKYFQSFSGRSHMLLNGNTLTSLELYRNQTDYSEKGSLFWTLDRTQTRFGQRLLRRWVGRPLLQREKLEERVAAVEELKDGTQGLLVDKLRVLLSKVKYDLEKGLIRIYYGKTLQRISNEFASFESAEDVGFGSGIINNAIAVLPTISDDIVGFLEKINAEAARSNDKYAFFRDSEETDGITGQKLAIACVEQELDQYRTIAAEKVRKTKVDYVTVSGIEVSFCTRNWFGHLDPLTLLQYLIEVENSQLKNVPASWAKISGTKRLSRFHAPEVLKMIRERDQHKEALAAECDKAFSQFLASIASRYQMLRDTVQSLAVLDCLLSLAEVASQPGYVKPEYTDETRICVKQGRHPMVEQLLVDSYVPNDIDLRTDGHRAMLITGPNMGGKSSYVRQVALIAIMGQIGSYVPAESAKLGMLDAVFTRMGAFDNMMAGESTFMVELSETSDILKQATSRSLVILDELGRGTSTHDGVAIAQAVLNYMLRDLQSLTLFVTHYQTLSTMARGFEHGELVNSHMRFEEKGEEGDEITFLYEVTEGVAHRSYGLNVASLANVPKTVIDIAAIKSRELEGSVKVKKLTALSRILTSSTNLGNEQLEQLVAGIEQL
ncbi:Mismatch repair protein msh3 [Glutinoglossum americanum]|uniref:DNA mismatch repair protein MSH3 n=1 Tax=Glutinoglossum americanum TaxID=1670608 RepID=A0A9P8I6N6_9PEZI|nr:Mismatch repair protein msh3 [Glutinoglossum americanum]